MITEIALMGETRIVAGRKFAKNGLSSKHMKGPDGVQVLFNTTEMLFEIIKKM